MTKKLIELIKQKFEDPNTVTLSEILVEITELERLAEIGRAVEFFFEYPYCGSLRHLGDERHWDYITYTEIDEVVNMYKEFKAYRERSGL